MQNLNLLLKCPQIFSLLTLMKGIKGHSKEVLCTLAEQWAAKMQALKVPLKEIKPGPPVQMSTVIFVKDALKVIDVNFVLIANLN